LVLAPDDSVLADTLGRGSVAVTKALPNGTHAPARPGKDPVMLPTIAGVMVTLGTVTGLFWDWWRHPDL